MSKKQEDKIQPFFSHWEYLSAQRVINAMDSKRSIGNGLSDHEKQEYAIYMQRSLKYLSTTSTRNNG